MVKGLNVQIFELKIIQEYEFGEKSWKSIKQKLKTITHKTTPMSFDERIQKLKETTQDWLNYFRMASIQGKLKELDGWVRNRLR